MNIELWYIPFAYIYVEIFQRQDIENLKDSVWPEIEAVKDKQISALSLTKSDNWLRTIEDKVLVLHQEVPRVHDPLIHPAQTISFFG